MTFKHAVTAPARGLKSITRMVFPRHGRGWARVLGLRRGGFNYSREVGDGFGSSVLTIPVMWMARTFPEAPVIVVDQDQAPIELHPMVQLLRRPNPFYSGTLLWMATIVSWLMCGDAYWIKVRNKAGGVEELWFVPANLIEPEVDEGSSEFITHYTYRPQGESIRLENSEVVHFRYGLDPQDPRKGWSPLRGVLAEVFTDDEAANFTAALLHNMGVPGVIVSPKGDVEPDPDDVAAVKSYVREEFTGNKRGEPLVFSGPTEVSQFGFSPEQLNLKALRRIPEERVSGAIGIPAIVCGFGAGLDRSTFANYAEAREAAYEDGIIPTQRLFGEDLWHQLLPDFDTDAARRNVGWDRSKVRVLQEDRNKEADRAAVLVKAGIWMRSRALEALGEESTPADEVYLLPLSVVITAKDQAPVDPDAEPDPSPPPAPPGAGGKRRKSTQRKRLGQLLARDVDHLAHILEQDLEPQLAGLGDLAATTYLSLVDEDTGKRRAGLGDAKDLTETAAALVDAMLKLIDFTGWIDRALKTRLERHYQRVGRRTVQTINTALELDVLLTEHSMNALVREGGERRHLLDVEEDTKRAIVRAIQEGTEAGDNPKTVARRIREQVPAGRYVNAGAKYRAELITRTETLHAQRLASLDAYDDSPVVEAVIALDGDQDEDCAARNGKRFSIDDARAEQEHPNGTLTWLPAVREREPAGV